MVSFLLHFTKFIEHTFDISHPLASTINVLTIILLTLLLGYILVKWLLSVIRHYEKTEKRESKTVSLKIEQMLESREDILLQNQISHLVEIKPTRFRHRTIRFVLFAVYNLALFYWNKGKLGSIPTIHFARWVIINKGKRLLFLSNFDNSWESYLGDFVDKAAVGLTGIWSNTLDYPPTKNIIFAGATNEEVFKKWSRYHQIPTQVWYTAYPNISVRNIINNTKIRNGLYKNLKGEKLNEWLRRF